ncbi:hypothetical protein DQ04_13121010 [Trypanosoma grayi]|uniref:hypothetical protein n=1 Tax=Trypanosoma grayi TaxID=71804 RepID=UPI0004F449FC|nr:hypothetical protein DQ04_13121010 [Trypanosoma grayi]KEG06600.1 hypothetical protein DQ04_13121010 [Trypanosoma grayi]
MGQEGDGNCGATATFPSVSSSSEFSPRKDAPSSGSWVSRLTLLFYARLACGDDLPPLIQHIRTQLRNPPAKEVTDTSLPASSSAGTSFVGAAMDRIPAAMQQIHEKAAIVPDISDDEDLQLRRAARVALLFSVESEGAQDEATRLLYEPSVAQLARCAPRQGEGAFLPLPPRVDYLLSDRVAVSYARRWAQEGRWDWGLQLLARAATTRTTTAAAVELFSHAGHWDRAVHCLSTIPPAAWSELEVSATVRSLYRASQERRRGEMTNAPAPELWRLALHVLNTSCENNVRLSTPSAVNDALGLLGIEGRQWALACHVVESMLLDHHEGSVTSDSMHKVRPNVVSVYQMCRALRRQWHLALHYASLMMYQGDVRIEDDREMAERLLRACIKGNRWAEALHTVKQRLERSTSDRGTKSEESVSANTFLDVLRMLNDYQKGPLATRLLQESQLSKHFSKDVTGKAYNTMLRYSGTVAEAQLCLQTIKSLGMALENESCEHLLILYAREGDWEQALSSLNLLLEDPQRRRLYIPSAKTHDAVQYALERAPPPGPSWEVSLRLFSRMSDLQVPVSEVAFQSTVKKCFAQGQSGQAQAIFQFVMRHGVHK